MARYYFDASSEDLRVTDFHGREIGDDDEDEVRSAVIAAVAAIRRFLGSDLTLKAWDLEVRVGADGHVSTLPFEDVDALMAQAANGGPASFAA